MSVQQQEPECVNDTDESGRESSKMCLRIDDVTMDWLIREAGRRQAAEGKIVSVNDLVRSLFAEDVGYEIPLDFKITKVKNPENEDRPTCTPRLPNELRERLDKVRRRYKQLNGQSVGYAELLINICREVSQQQSQEFASSSSSPRHKRGM